MPGSSPFLFAVFVFGSTVASRNFSVSKGESSRAHTSCVLGSSLLFYLPSSFSEAPLLRPLSLTVGKISGERRPLSLTVGKISGERRPLSLTVGKISGERRPVSLTGEFDR